MKLIIWPLLGGEMIGKVRSSSEVFVSLWFLKRRDQASAMGRSSLGSSAIYFAIPMKRSIPGRPGLCLQRVYKSLPNPPGFGNEGN